MKATKAFRSCALAIASVATLVGHVKFGSHRLIIENCRPDTIEGMSIVVVTQRQLRTLAPGEMVTSRFGNPWPKDAAVELAIPGRDGSVEKHECLYLGFLPQVASIRLLANGGVECTTMAPSILVPF